MSSSAEQAAGVGEVSCPDRRRGMVTVVGRNGELRVAWADGGHGRSQSRRVQCALRGRRAGRRKRSAAWPAVLLTWLMSLLVCFSGVARAQDQDPHSVPALAGFIAAGAALKAQPPVHGLTPWSAAKDGKAEVIYTTEDGQLLVIGDVFEGGIQGLRQQHLERAKADMEAVLALARAGGSLGDTMMADIEASSWFRVGDPSAPVVYVFADAECPACHQFMLNAATALEQKSFQLRVIPVSILRNERSAQYDVDLLAAGDGAAALWQAHMKGDNSGLVMLPGDGKKAEEELERNTALFFRWQLKGIPFLVFRASHADAGKNVRLVYGVPQDLQGILAEIAP